MTEMTEMTEPYECPECGHRAPLVVEVIDKEVKVRDLGTITIPQVEISRCSGCNARHFTAPQSRAYSAQLEKAMSAGSAHRSP